MRIRARRGAVAALALLLALTGCSASSGAGSGAGGEAGGGVAAPDAPGAVGGDEGVGSTGERDVIVTGWLDVTVADPLNAADQARRIVERSGGRLDSVSKEPGGSFQDPSAQLVTRIPAEKLDDYPGVPPPSRAGSARYLTRADSVTTGRRSGPL